MEPIYPLTKEEMLQLQETDEITVVRWREDDKPWDVCWSLVEALDAEAVGVTIHYDDPLAQIAFESTDPFATIYQGHHYDITRLQRRTTV